MPNGGSKKHSDDKWIQRAFNSGGIKAGGLHASLGIPKGQKIPASKLKVSPNDSPLVKKQKALAKTFKKMRG